MSIPDISSFIDVIKNSDKLLVIDAPVDPKLEIAEIHRRVIAENGPALLFTNVKGSPYPVATNLFGTTKRVELAFGKRPQEFISEIAKLPHELVPPTLDRKSVV